MAASVAIFDKQIHNEIITTTTTVQNATIPGFANPVALTIVTPSNVNKAEVDGVEAALSDVNATSCRASFRISAASSTPHG